MFHFYGNQRLYLLYKWLYEFRIFLNLAKLFRKKQEDEEEVGEGVFVKCQYFPIEN